LSSLKRLLVFGAPGAGKGTYLKLLNPALGNLPVIEAGDIVRTSIKTPGVLTPEQQDHVEKGGLLPDELITRLVLTELHKVGGSYVLDGYPRTIEQAGVLQNQAPDLRPQMVLCFQLPEFALVEKLLARLNCVKCGQGYNSADIRGEGLNLPPLNPKVPGICDKCGGELVTRKDDNLETIQRRLRLYRDNTEPLLGFYEEMGILVKWNVKNGVDDSPEIQKLVEEAWRTRTGERCV